MKIKREGCLENDGIVDVYQLVRYLVSADSEVFNIGADRTVWFTDYCHIDSVPTVTLQLPCAV